MHDGDLVDQLMAQWGPGLAGTTKAAHAVSKRLARLTAHIENATSIELTPLEIDLGEFDVLLSLLRQGSPYALKPRDLAKAGLVTASGMTKRIDRLEARGLVKRELDPSDRRALRVLLTTEGVRKAQLAVDARERALAVVLAPLSARELDELSATLRRLTLPLDLG